MNRKNYEQDSYARSGPRKRPDTSERNQDAGYSDSRQGERSERRAHGEEAFRHYPSGSPENWREQPEQRRSNPQFQQRSYQGEPRRRDFDQMDYERRGAGSRSSSQRPDYGRSERSAPSSGSQRGYYREQMGSYGTEPMETAYGHDLSERGIPRPGPLWEQPDAPREPRRDQFESERGPTNRPRRGEHGEDYYDRPRERGHEPRTWEEREGYPMRPGQENREYSTGGQNIQQREQSYYNSDETPRPERARPSRERGVRSTEQSGSPQRPAYQERGYFDQNQPYYREDEHERENRFEAESQTGSLRDQYESWQPRRSRQNEGDRYEEWLEEHPRNELHSEPQQGGPRESDEDSGKQTRSQRLRGAGSRSSRNAGQSEAPRRVQSRSLPRRAETAGRRQKSSKA